MPSFKLIKSQIKKELVIYKALYKDDRTPFIAKVLLGAAVGYLFFPFDLIPDFIPVLGQLDELIVIPLLIYLALKFIPEVVYNEHKSKAQKQSG